MLPALFANLVLLCSCPSGGCAAPVVAVQTFAIVRSYHLPVPVVRHAWRPMGRLVRVVRR